MRDWGGGRQNFEREGSGAPGFQLSPRRGSSAGQTAGVCVLVAVLTMAGMCMLQPSPAPQSSPVGREDGARGPMYVDRRTYTHRREHCMYVHR